MKRALKAGISLLALLISGTAGAICDPNMTITKPDSIYTNHGNGTVTDNQTGLMWMQCSQGLSGAGCATGSDFVYNWKQALEVAQTANAGAGAFGYTDWRLPDKNELASLVESACYNPSINSTLFPATVSDWYWSSSPAAGYNHSSWLVGFSYGDVDYSIKNLNYYVRLVRGGQ